MLLFDFRLRFGFSLSSQSVPTFVCLALFHFLLSAQAKEMVFLAHDETLFLYCYTESQSEEFIVWKTGTKLIFFQSQAQSTGAKMLLGKSPLLTFHLNLYLHVPVIFTAIFTHPSLY